MIGIGTREMLGINNSHKDNLSIAYNARTGNIWESGVCKKMGPPIIDGQTVTFEINLAQKRALWMIDGKKIGKATIG